MDYGINSTFLILNRLFSFAQNSLHRWANCFIRAMNTTQPTTRSSNSFFKLTDYSFNVLVSRLLFLDEGGPTDPFIARKWS